MSENLVARIEGYASIFGAPDMNGDVVAPGAFRARRPAAEIRFLYQHAAEVPIGRWLSLAEHARGLYATGELILGSDAAREAYALIAGGGLDGLSIGFRTVRARREKGRRVILEADLWEVSLVTFPMAPGARVTRLGPPEKPAPPEAAFTRTLKEAARLLAA
ncbi:MAG: HK97 family phage prohead protease [Amphiplicatus sp.]